MHLLFSVIEQLFAQLHVCMELMFNIHLWLGVYTTYQSFDVSHNYSIHNIHVSKIFHMSFLYICVLIQQLLSNASL